MSRRTAEANKAIQLAWEREQALVRKGRGTRDWGRRQQQDILDPMKGKAYDENGRAFEGQHMMSVAEYPEYQGDPNNIQFLTKEEHLEAHKGSWQNPTNWYYNPETKKYVEFKDNKPVPCEIIDLSNPIVIKSKRDDGLNKGKKGRKKRKNKNSGVKISRKGRVKSRVVKVAKGIKNVGNYIVENPSEALEIVKFVGEGITIVDSATSVIRKINKGSSDHFYEITNEETFIADNEVNNNITPPQEHNVSKHRQRYHTKEGIVWRDKAEYIRGKHKDTD